MPTFSQTQVGRIIRARCLR